MDIKELEAQLEFDKLNHQLDTLKEFEALAPKTRDFYLKLLGVVVLYGLVLWLYPEIGEQPISLLLLILIVGVAGNIQKESVRINKRIDLLYKLVNKDVKHSNKY